MTARKAYRGPAVLSAGFRPFFLLASLFAATVIPVWLMAYSGRLELAGPFAPVDWHVHEMLFGYAGAVVAGFLFTAVPNWTGRMPARGWPLAALGILWLAGRLAVAGVFGLRAWSVLLIDTAFLAALGAMIATEVIAGRNWRNLKVLAPVLLLFVANVSFHLEAMRDGSAPAAMRMGLGVVLFLVMLIGGRIIPSFTRNWLVQRKAARLPKAFGRYDGISLVAAAGALALWTAAPEGRPTAALLGLAALLHFARLLRWRGAAAWASPLLLMLHVAYGFLPLGLAAMTFAALGGSPVAGFHLLGIGVVGTMTFAVMLRASKGHTGRALEAGPLMTSAFAMLVVAALTRSFLWGTSFAGLSGIVIAGTFWTLGFALFVLRVGPWLLLPKAAPKRPSPRPAAPTARVN